MLAICTCKNVREATKRAASKKNQRLREHRVTKDGALECLTCGRRKPRELGI